MKKRILALALAGTTAFSVFGAAISANAAWPSTDTRYEVDAYQTYTPVAKTISSTIASTGKTYNKYFLKSTGTAGIPIAEDNNGSGMGWPTIEEYLTLAKDIDNVSNPGNGKVQDDAYKSIRTNYDSYTKISIPNGQATNTTGSDVWATYNTYYVRWDASANKYQVLSSDGKQQGGDLDSFLGYTDTGVYLKTATTSSGAQVSFYSVDAMLNAYKADNISYYRVKNPSGADATDTDAVTIYHNNASDTANASTYFTTAVKYVNNQAWIDENCFVVPTTVNGSAVNADITVTSDPTNAVNSWTGWDFDSSMTTDTTVDPFETQTRVVTDPTLGTYLKVTKNQDPTIYAYDFLYNTNLVNSASTIASAWNTKVTDTAAAALGNHNADGVLKAETGRGNVNYGVRYDVVSDWIDFLDNLAINGDSKGYVESESEFVSNYADMFYSDPIFNIWGEQIGTVDVDLYNIKSLLHDIYSLNNASEYYYANTSELVYLMQQYDKYIGNYIDKAEVEGTEWGELMLSVLNAATADDFKKSSDYKKYMNKVDDLEDAYEDATTLGMIKEAEVGMYNLLTTTSSYTASSTADKTELSATLNGLYFNAKSAPGVYSVAPSTVDASRATYTNYNYVVAVVDTDAKDNPYAFSTSLKPGYYSLYPMADYIDNDTTTPNSNYNGNVASKDFNGKYATEEYEWFWNVYQLAVKMSGTNKYQGAVDAINEALNDAVSNLTVTTSPAAVDTGAMEDAVAKYEGKIDTDYNEGYYAKYTQANDYAENVAEGKWQTRIAAMITGVAGEALTYQGTQVTVTKNDMKTVEEAIKNGKTALKAIKEDANYNAAQVTALNKAIAAAEDLVSLYEGTYGTTKSVQSVNKVYTRLVGDKDQMVKSDLTKAIEAIDAAINYSEIVMGWSKNEAGKWQYGTEEGYLSNGWNQVDGGKTWFYFNEDGTAKQSEWWNDNGTWYWFNSNCGAATGWAKVDGEWYFFKGNNAMKTGWEKVDGNWYYMASSGKMVTGWCEIGGKWYYFSKKSNSLGQMLYNTTVDGYKLDANGVWVK